MASLKSLWISLTELALEFPLGVDLLEEDLEPSAAAPRLVPLALLVLPLFMVSLVYFVTGSAPLCLYCDSTVTKDEYRVSSRVHHQYITSLSHNSFTKFFSVSSRKRNFVRLTHFPRFFVFFRRSEGIREH